MIKIHILTCGEVGVDETVPNRGTSRNPLAYTGLFRSKSHRIHLPVKAFYIDHPKGRLLVDAGWDSAVRQYPIRTLTLPMWFASKPILPPGAAVDEQLSALGVKPDMLNYVIMTHMDIDHDSGLRLVRNAKHIMISSSEWEAIHSSQVRYVKKPWENFRLEQFPFTSDDTTPFGLAWDVFGDQTVTVISTPGHSQGSVTVRVCDGKRFVLIVGDTGYNSDSWEKLNLPGPLYDQASMKKSLLWVAEQRKMPECVAVLAAHDSAEKRKEIDLEGSI